MNRQPTVREILKKTEDYLRGKAIDSPRLSAQLILSKGLGLDRMGLFLNMDRPLSPVELDALRPLVARRGRGEPAAYIAGEREFFSMAFEVTPEVLIPRPETELIVEQALKLFPEGGARFADLGTGSGCLAVCLAARLPGSRGTALDKSPGALEVARRNAARHGVADRIDFVEASFEDLPPAPGGYALVVSNPPYVSEDEYRELSPEVAGFEPRSALVPGPAGLEAYPVVAASARDRLAPGGVLMVEIGWKQGRDVAALLQSPEYGFQEVRVLADLAGLDRVVTGRRPL